MGTEMGTVEKSIVVDRPVSTVYNQWTQFEDFPAFMEGVEEVRQIDDRTLHWRSRVAGVEREWQAEIFDQQPDQRIAWRSTSGFRNNGAVSFMPESADATRVTLRIDFEEEGMAEKAADALGIIDRRVSGDLDRFKEFIEDRSRATGAWREKI